MFYRKMIMSAACALAIAASAATFPAKAASNTPSARVLEPLNLAILIQDDLTSQVSNELNVTRNFINSLPSGSRVMVGYITTGSLQVRQQFTSDLNEAAQSLRVVRSSSFASAYNPYVEVVKHCVASIT